MPLNLLTTCKYSAASILPMVAEPRAVRYNQPFVTRNTVIKMFSEHLNAMMFSEHLNARLFSLMLTDLILQWTVYLGQGL